MNKNEYEITVEKSGASEKKKRSAPEAVMMEPSDLVMLLYALEEMAESAFCGEALSNNSAGVLTERENLSKEKNALRWVEKYYDDISALVRLAMVEAKAAADYISLIY